MLFKLLWRANPSLLQLLRFPLCLNIICVVTGTCSGFVVRCLAKDSRGGTTHAGNSHSRSTKYNFIQIGLCCFDYTVDLTELQPEEKTFENPWIKACDYKTTVLPKISSAIFTAELLYRPRNVEGYGEMSKNILANLTTCVFWHTHSITLRLCSLSIMVMCFVEVFLYTFSWTSEFFQP